MRDRHEYYKARGVTLEVTTCDCCKIDGYRDAWQLDRSGRTHIGISDKHLREQFILITEAEARKRAPALFDWPAE